MTALRIALAWENFGPSHIDRIAACVEAGFDVTAIEFNATSLAYQWEAGEAQGARRITLGEKGARVSGLRLTWRLFRAVRANRVDAAFLCHYQSFAVFFAAVLLRLAGCRVFTMLDSKFDDYPRNLAREAGKVILLAPYQGALAGSRRSGQYLHFLGFRNRPVVGGFDTLDLARIRASGEAGGQQAHSQRDFLIVARLVEKKNLAFAIQAYAAWKEQAVHPRKLRIIGYGELESSLKALAADLDVADDVIFAGLAESGEVCTAMRNSLCLILPSIEEQFGLVVTEALALGLPVAVSSNAGSVDELIDNGVNGWIVDPYRPAALVAAMARFDRDEREWQTASAAALASSERGGVDHFVSGVKALTAGDQPA